MKLKVLALCILAAGLVSCSKPTVDQQIERLQKAYEQNDCDKIRDIYFDLLVERDEKEFTEEQGIALFAIMLGGKCDCDLEGLYEELEEAKKQKEEK
ncbi:MAG: hypothetical protein MSS82_06520 [Bacteroidales bacterium]|nr:hypothetical protein [Bacteroidales bacterium]